MKVEYRNWRGFILREVASTLCRMRRRSRASTTMLPHAAPKGEVSAVNPLRGSCWITPEIHATFRRSCQALARCANRLELSRRGSKRPSTQGVRGVLSVNLTHVSMRNIQVGNFRMRRDAGADRQWPVSAGHPQTPTNRQSGAGVDVRPDYRRYDRRMASPAT